MVLKKCSELKPGMVIAKDVHTRTGILLMTSGETIDIEDILKLNQNSISFVFVQEELKKERTSARREIEKEKAKPKRIPFSDEKESYYDKIQTSEDFKLFRGKFSAGVVKLRGILNRLIKNDGASEMSNSAKKLIEGMKMPSGSIPVFDLLSNMRRFDDVVYVHSLNVAMLGGMLAEWLDYSEEDVALVKECGLFHDIGKLTIPVEIITKPAKVTRKEYDIIKTHSEAGANILRELGAHDIVVRVAYEHHQKCDGSGYPSGFDPKKLHPFSKIITMVDIYDAITSARSYRGMVCPFKVIRMFEDEGMAKYDTRVYKVFLERIANNFIGNRVKLNDGRIARVLMTNKTYYSMPMVISNGEYIDLAKRRDLYIDEVI